MISKSFRFFLFCFVLSGCTTVSLPSKLSVHSSKVFQVQTADGWNLTLHRFQPRTLSSNDPVILLLGSPKTNALFWHLENSVNFSRYLSKRGWDVWALSFRGTDQSQGEGAYQYFDYVHQDLPAAISFIQTKTGRSQIAAMGHSFGASILLSYLSSDQTNHIDQAVVIAPPFKYLKPLPDFFSFSLDSDLFQPLFLNWQNISSEVQSRYAILADQNWPKALVDIYDRLSQDGEIPENDSWRSIQIPILFIAGKKDNLAPTESVLDLYEQILSNRKTFREFGRNNFYQIDYDHHDFILSRYAKKEVYPFVYQWLEKEKNEK